MRETINKEKVKACVAILVIILVILIAGIIIMKYNVEGETNMPYKLSKITIVSTAEGVENEEAQEKWNLSIFQNNDLYFSIEKNRILNIRLTVCIFLLARSNQFSFYLP